MYDARAVANYFLQRAEQRGLTLTLMTLQKVLYFAHAWHLVKYKEPLVAQPFEAWKYGPVNRVIYDQLKGCGRTPIRQRLKSFDTQVCDFVDAPPVTGSETTSFLNDLFDYYVGFDPFKLSDLTHKKGSPWDLIWKEAEKRAVPGMIIPDSLIVEWFKRNDTHASYKQ